MPAGRVWNESVVNSYPNLRDFLSASDSIDQVLRRKDKLCTRNLNPLNPNLAFRWKVCQIATAPFRVVLAIVLSIISKVAGLIGANGVRKHTRDSARFLMRGFNVYSEESTKLFRIKCTRNRPTEDGQIVNKTAFVPKNQITDLKLRARTYAQYNGIKFNHNNGICKGMAEWFFYLYLNTKNQFSDPRSHMSALGKQFQNGGGQDPTLLQSFHIRKGKLLGLKIGTQRAHSPNTPVKYLHQPTTAEWKSGKQNMINQLQNLPVGVYETWVPKHATGYIKINNNLGFFFDPNHGITEINGDTQGEKLYELISTALSNTGEYVNPTELHWNRIEVAPVTSR